MNIACLGWGSLIWRPKDLPVDEWKQDGPSLPVEFARQSRDGRLTLVLLPDSERVSVLYAALNLPNLEAAILALANRENCARRNIGYWAGSNAVGRFPHAQAIGKWATDKGLDAVVWTALPARFGDVDGRIPTSEDVISYATALEGNTRQLAEEYVRRTPRQIRTPYRKLFELKLGWHPR